MYVHSEAAHFGFALMYKYWHCSHSRECRTKDPPICQSNIPTGFAKIHNKRMNGEWQIKVTR